jgi:DNA-binding NtrC family response regulator
VFLNPPLQPDLVNRTFLLGTIRTLSFGGDTNVRFICATNRDLDKMTQSGEFRQDLFYRLNIARVHLPPLREHRDDIPLMLRHYIDEFNSRSRRDDVGFTDEVCRCLMSYEWPGNIRELKNVLESVMVDAQGRKIGIESLPEPIRRSVEEAGSTDSSEREKLLAALFCTRWNKSKAAERLNWSRMTLYRKLVKHRIVTPK